MSKISRFKNLEAWQIKKSQEYINSADSRKFLDDLCMYKAKKSNIEATLLMIDRIIAQNSANIDIEMQSDEVAISTSGDATGSTEVIGTLTDMIGGITQNARIGNVSTKEVAVKHTRFGIDKFFERPVFIGTTTWQNGVDLNSYFQVSNIYFQDPSVRAKLRNVSFMKASIVVTISVAGNEFMYGCNAVAPLLYDLQNAPLIAAIAANTSAPGNLPFLAKYLMNYPGARVMDVNKNNVMKFKIPFISPLNTWRLYNDSAAALGTSTNYTDLLNYLSFRLVTINQLGTTAPAASNANISVYAHLEDVELGPPTASITAITTQSDEVKESEHDERVKGPVERIASRVAHAAGWFTDIPTIGPFATAAELGAGAVADIAALFGWSVPTLNTPPSRMKNHPFQNAAHTIGYDTGFRLTVDPRQEVSVSPSVVATDEDEMCIAKLASMESLLYTYVWTTGGTPVSSALFTIPVHPRANASTVSGLKNVISPTWVEFAASPFAWWRGRMKFRLQVACSPKHKGKLGIFYEPNAQQATLINAGLSLNKQLIKIIDLQETQDVCFEIDWSFPRPWASTTMTDNIITGSLPYATNNFETCNGYFSVFALTALQSPNGNGCFINTWVSCPDLQVTEPSTNYIPAQHILYQSDEEKYVEGSECCVLNPTGFSNKDICEYTFGEQVMSFRSLLHRFESTYTGTVAADAGANVKHVEITHRAMPVFPTYSTLWTDVTLLTYLRGAYLAWSGGFKKRIRLVGYDQKTLDQISVLLANTSGSSTTFASLWVANLGVPMDFRGGVTFVSHTNGGIEFEIPYYSNNRFGWANSADEHGPASTATYSYNYALRNYLFSLELYGATNAGKYIEETAIAEDFKLMRLCAPPPRSY